MKNGLMILMALTILASADSASARLQYSKAGPSMAKTKQVQQSLSPAMSTMKDVVGSGISACEVDSGALFTELTEDQKSKALFVHCLTILTATQEAKAALETLYPRGQYLAGTNVFAHIVYAGVTTPQ